jgi:hypothetical protein
MRLLGVKTGRKQADMTMGFLVAGQQPGGGGVGNGDGGVFPFLLPADGCLYAHVYVSGCLAPST